MHFPDITLDVVKVDSEPKDDLTLMLLQQVRSVPALFLLDEKDNIIDSHVGIFSSVAACAAFLRSALNLQGQKL